MDEEHLDSVAEELEQLLRDVAIVQDRVAGLHEERDQAMAEQRELLSEQQRIIALLDGQVLAFVQNNSVLPPAPRADTTVHVPSAETQSMLDELARLTADLPAPLVTSTATGASSSTDGPRANSLGASLDGLLHSAADRQVTSTSAGASSSTNGLRANSLGASLDGTLHAAAHRRVTRASLGASASTDGPRANSVGASPDGSFHAAPCPDEVPRTLIGAPAAAWPIEVAHFEMEPSDPAGCALSGQGQAWMESPDPFGIQEALLKTHLSSPLPSSGASGSADVPWPLALDHGTAVAPYSLESWQPSAGPSPYADAHGISIGNHLPHNTLPTAGLSPAAQIPATEDPLLAQTWSSLPAGAARRGGETRLPGQVASSSNIHGAVWRQDVGDSSGVSRRGRAKDEPAVPSHIGALGELSHGQHFSL